MLENLPPEIMSMVLEHCRERTDLASLCLVSKFLHSSTAPQLYKSVVLYAHDEEDLSDLKTECFSLGSPYLKYTREIALVANFRRVLRHRCHDVDSDSDDEVDTSDDDDVESDSSEGRDSSHLSQSDNASTSEESHAPDDHPDSPQRNAPSYGTSMPHREWTYDPTGAGQTSASDVYLTPHEEFSEALESKLLPFLDLIPEGWGLGTCLPESVVDYLCQQQPQIASLEVVTDVTCLGAGYLNVFELHGFVNLRHIRWVANIPDGDEFSESPGKILRDNAATLEEIEIDEVGCGALRRSVPNGNVLLHEVLSLGNGPVEKLFPSLKKLTLSAVSFDNGFEDVPTVFSFHDLHYLALRNCPRVNEVLRVLSSTGSVPEVMQLTAFEINNTWGRRDYGDIASLTKFLLSFQGLEHLFISCPRVPEVGVLRSIVHHKGTLKRLLCHQPQINAVQSLQPPQFNDDGYSLKEALKELTNLECFGVNYLPGKLESILSQIYPRPHIRLLHIRAFNWLTFKNHREKLFDRSEAEFFLTLPEVRRFASWAFGPNGLPKLQVLAYGDFAYQGRRRNIALCRNAPFDGMEEKCSNLHPSDQNNREVTRTDVMENGIIDANKPFLEACPEDSLLYKDNYPF